jgi:hypothetical protein
MRLYSANKKENKVNQNPYVEPNTAEAKTHTYSRQTQPKQLTIT